MKYKILSLAVKLILFLSIITSVNNHYWHIASTNLFLLILTFTPQILKKYTKIKIPTSFEIGLLVFVLLTLTLGKISGIVAPLLFGIGIGFAGFLILLIMYSSNQIKKNYLLILSYTFSISIAFAATLELAKYYLKLLLNQLLSPSVYQYTMTNLTYVIIGATISCLIGFIYMKTHFKFLQRVIDKLKSSNPDLFKKTNSIEEIIKEIKQGESETQEFKSTLRINTHTGVADKRIEHATLKTITALLNTKGGTLYLGVTDDGKILGIEKDGFQNTDKFQLHLTHLINNKLGKHAKALIDIKTIEIKDRNIARIDCTKSKTPIFLKQGETEEFFIRLGPQSQELKGSDLINYTNKRFHKKK
jgi:hypothetical protein